MTARLTPDWQPETVDQRIERVLASVPDLCPACGGEGVIPGAAHDGDDWFVVPEPCPTCTRSEGES